MPIDPRVLSELDQGESGLCAWLRLLQDRPTAGGTRDALIQAIKKRRYSIDHPAPWAAAHWGLVDPREAHPRAFALAEHSLLQLRDLPEERRGLALRQMRRQVVNPALIELVLLEARQNVSSKVSEALGWLDLGVAVMARLEARNFPAFLVAPFRLRLTAYRANAHRASGDLSLAARLFDCVITDPDRTALPPLGSEAELLSLEGSLRIAERDFRRADDLLARAEALYRALGDLLGLPSVLITRGVAAEYSGKSERALCFQRAAQALLATSKDSKLYLAAVRNQADTLVSLGRLDEADAILTDHLGRFLAEESPVNLLRGHWIEGRIARARGHFREAEMHFEEVRDGMLNEERHLDAALATLDATEASLAQGKWEKAKQQAIALEPIFEVRGVHREALVALHLFQESVAGEVVTTAGIARLRRYLLVGQNDANYRFEEALGE